MAGAPEPPTSLMTSTEQQLRLSLAEEATCPICLGYFAEPVFLQCGHTFCTPCITRYWEGVQGLYPCPQCRETAPTSTLRPNRLVASMVQILAHGPPVAPPGEGPLMCSEHEEKLKLFCQEDQSPICVVCDRSREHRGHTVTPIREAAQEYKDKIQGHLNDVKSQLEKVQGLQLKEEAKLTELQEKFKTQKERIASAFDQVQQFLEKERCRHLSDLEEKEKKILQRIRAKMSELGKRQAWVREQITEMELKCQQPDVELLKDMKSILRRFENVKSPHPFSGHHKEMEKENEKREGEHEVQKEESNKKEEEKADEVDENGAEEDQEDVAEDLLMRITESLEWRWARRYAGEVTLDPDTANIWLALSEDGRSVRHGDRAQDLPDTPERFNPIIIVLGRERLSSGRHYWEVEVGAKTRWDLGVCDESVSRKGEITLSPEDGYWAVCLIDGKYEALSSLNTPLTPSVPPRVVGLFLDYEAGRFSVYNVTDRSLLFTFPEASFPRTLCPFFCPGPRNGRKNAGALRVLPVTGQE